jgi:hypothetical protein
MRVRIAFFSSVIRHLWPLGANTWLCFHRGDPSWKQIFGDTLNQLSIAVSDQKNGMKLDGGRGTIRWRSSRHWTKINIELQGFNPQKRKLVAMALIKAARFHQP